MADYKRIQEWQIAVDDAELNPLEYNLPETGKVGDIYIEGGKGGHPDRKWIRVKVITGTNAGRWAYWNSWKTEIGQRGIGPHPQFEAIADKIFNCDTEHFIGMLQIPYVRPREGAIEGWVLIEPKVKAYPIINYIEEVKSPTRYERSKEVYDVETGETKLLP